ncbi:AAA family ATPase, partial [Candidatus Dependentiae bacterium]|nr:AAA family ATPase [Candidatus Dependentiae bacterium]
KNMLIDFGVRFNKKENSKVYLLESLNKLLIKEYSENRIVATIIDESQLISIETLEEIRLLTNLETNNHKLIQIILCGQPDFDRIINSDRLQQLKQRINFYCHLLPLSFEEMINYINHRMHIAGRPEPVPITENALKLIYFYSKGIPRIVNSICDKSMISAYAYDKSEVNVNCVVSGIQMLEGNTDRKKVYIELFKIMISRYYRYAFWITIIFFLALIYLSKIMNV